MCRPWAWHHYIRLACFCYDEHPYDLKYYCLSYVYVSEKKHILSLLDHIDCVGLRNSELLLCWTIIVASYRMCVNMFYVQCVLAEVLFCLILLFVYFVVAFLVKQCIVFFYTYVGQFCLRKCLFVKSFLTVL